MRFLIPVLAISLSSSIAFAAVDCPPGSVQKTEGSNAWCEPSVCDPEAPKCQPGEVCKPVPLCVEIGNLKPSGAAMTDAGGPLLMARQRCGPDKSCPSSTVCNEKARCIAKVDAEKMGLLAAPAGSSAGAAEGTAKKSCGCSVPGAASGGATTAGLVLGLGLVIAARRRRSFAEGERRPAPRDRRRRRS